MERIVGEKCYREGGRGREGGGREGEGGGREGGGREGDRKFTSCG